MWATAVITFGHYVRARPTLAHKTSFNRDSVFAGAMPASAKSATDISGAFRLGVALSAIAATLCILLDLLEDLKINTAAQKPQPVLGKPVEDRFTHDCKCG